MRTTESELTLKDYLGSAAVTEAVFNGGLALAVSSFIAMNFTGSSTYTSLSGVKKEMRIAVPVQIATAVISCVTAVLLAVLKGSSI